MVNILRQQEITILELGPEYTNLDEAHLGRVAQQIVEVAKHASPPLMAIDLTHVETFDGYFVQFLIRIWKLIKKRGGQLVLVALSDECLNILKRSKLEALWDRYPDREKAIAALNRSGD